MRRAAQANWSRLPNHNPPRFYTAWVNRVGFVMSAGMSGLPQTADISGSGRHFAFVPTTEVGDTNAKGGGRPL